MSRELKRFKEMDYKSWLTEEYYSSAKRYLEFEKSATWRSFSDIFRLLENAEAKALWQSVNRKGEAKDRRVHFQLEEENDGYSSEEDNDYVAKEMVLKHHAPEKNLNRIDVIADLICNGSADDADIKSLTEFDEEEISTMRRLLFECGKISSPYSPIKECKVLLERLATTKIAKIGATKKKGICL